MSQMALIKRSSSKDTLEAEKNAMRDIEVHLPPFLECDCYWRFVVMAWYVRQS